MAQPSSISNSEEHLGRRLKAWGIVLLLVAACELTVFFAVESRAPIDDGARFYAAGTRPTLTSSLAQWQTVRARGLGNAPDVIFIGDSSCTMGVVPEIIESGTGLDVENLCLVEWLSIEGHIDVFEEYLRDHAAPRALIYHFSDSVLSRSDREFEELAMRGTYRHWLARDSDSMVYRWPSTRLRARARSMLGGHFYEETSNDSGIRDFMTRHHGFVRESRDGVAEIGVPPLPLHPDNADGIVRFFSLAAKHNMHVYMMHAAVPGVADGPGYQEQLAENQALITALASDYPGAEVAWSFSRLVATKYFRDYEHLTIEGAQMNSQAIVGWMREAGLTSDGKTRK